MKFYFVYFFIFRNFQIFLHKMLLRECLRLRLTKTISSHNPRPTVEEDMGFHLRARHSPVLMLFLSLSKGISNLTAGCLHPVACTRSGSGFPSNATLV
jgi:hypothetical protein